LKSFGYFAAIVLLAGCASAGTAPIPVPGHTGVASNTGPLGVSSSALSFIATGLTQTLTVSDPGYTGAFTTNGCSGIVTVTTATATTLNVTSAGGGTCALTVADSDGHQVSVAISVTAVSVPVQ
jgi:uncharacterized protein YceK